MVVVMTTMLLIYPEIICIICCEGLIVIYKHYPFGIVVSYERNHIYRLIIKRQVSFCNKRYGDCFAIFSPVHIPPTQASVFWNVHRNNKTLAIQLNCFYLARIRYLLVSGEIKQCTYRNKKGCREGIKYFYLCFVSVAIFSITSASSFKSESRGMSNISDKETIICRSG